MRIPLSVLGLAGIAAGLVSFSAQANSSGILGRSGKQGQTCMSGCHGSNSPSGLTPTVELSGPTSLEAGATGNYALIIRGGPAVKAGFNVAVSNGGGTLVAGSDQSVQGGELTHDRPKSFSDGEARFEFTLQAPASAGTVTLFGAGNSVNDNGDNSGDRAAATKLDVTVTGGTVTPVPGDNDEQDGGCATVGGPPLAALLVLVGLLRRRRG